MANEHQLVSQTQSSGYGATMRKLVMLLWVSLPLCAAPTEAQRADDTAIIRAAVDYLKRDLPRRQLIIDAEFLHGDAAAADAAAHQLGAKRDVIQNLVRCTGSRRGISGAPCLRMPWCWRSRRP
jgi:hypothetical protein